MQEELLLTRMQALLSQVALMQALLCMCNMWDAVVSTYIPCVAGQLRCKAEFDKSAFMDSRTSLQMLVVNKNPINLCMQMQRDAIEGLHWLAHWQKLIANEYPDVLQRLHNQERLMGRLHLLDALCLIMPS